MIDFDLNVEHCLLEQTVREWAARDVAPYIRENDRQHRFDRDRIVGGMKKLGLFGISVPQEYGGAGMDYVCLGLACEELEYVDTSLRVIMSVHAGLNCLTLLTWGGIHGITSSASSVMNDKVSMIPGRPCVCRMKGDSNVKTPE